MKTVIKPCRVPWWVSPTMDGLTLHHKEDNGTYCSIVFGGGRLSDAGWVDTRRIEISFSSADFVRTNPKQDDVEIDAIGFDVLEQYDTSSAEEYLEWLKNRWRETGLCPRSGFYIAAQSPWLSAVQGQIHSAADLHHYLLFGRDNYIEILATDFSWREWIWSGGEREQFSNPIDVVEAGSGVD